MKHTRDKHLTIILPKTSGRDAAGHVSSRHRGGRHKRLYRVIDWKRDKQGVSARVVALEYDPNRSSEVALLHYKDGEKRYILAPLGLSVGDKVVSSDVADIKPGNSLKLGYMPIGTFVHNIEIQPGHGAQMVRSAGGYATVLAKDGESIQLKLPSGEVRAFKASVQATVGQLGNAEWKNRVIGTAGRNRRLGKRPQVRGVAQNPRSHPHGGGEGRSGIGMPSPKSPWGKRTLGKKTRNPNKYSKHAILQRRK